MTINFKDIFKKLLADKLFRNGIIIFLFAMTGNFFSYLFQIAMGRGLSVVDYGTLNSLLSLLVVISVPSGALKIFSAKNVAHNIALDNLPGAKRFIGRTLKKTILYDGIFFIIFIFCIPSLMKFMHIYFFSYYLILGTAIFLTFPVFLILGALQGSRMYTFLGLYSGLMPVIRFTFAVLLVYTGFGLIGALFSIAISPLILLLISIVTLSIYFNSKYNKKEKVDIKNIKTKKESLKAGKSYFFSVFFTILFFTLVTNIDLVMVKHFFSGHEAGIYSVADILGKIILYFPAAFVLVMFPEVTHAHAKNNKTKYILLKTILITFLACSFIEIFYILFPQDIISVLMGSKYADSSSLLFLYGLSMFPFAFINILINYFMAVNNAKIIIPMFLFSISEVFLFSLFHNSLKEIIVFIMIIGWLILFTLMFYAFYDEIIVFFKKLYLKFQQSKNER